MVVTMIGWRAVALAHLVESIAMVHTRFPNLYSDMKRMPRARFFCFVKL